MSLDMQSLVTFAKTKGFVYPGSDIYGGLANSWDYGPLGSLMKENIKNLWIKNFVQKRKDMTLLDAAILMNPQVWVASGHVGGFSDPLIDNTDSNVRYRADKMIEDAKDINPDGLEVFAFRKMLIEKLSKERGLNWTFEEAQLFPIYKDYFSGEQNVVLNGKELVINADDEPDYKEIYTHRNGGSFEKWGGVNVPDEQSYNKNVIAVLAQNTMEDFMRWVMLRFIECPISKTKKWTKIRKFNLMFRTFQGVTEDSTATVYMRPETAQGIFVNFPNIARSSRKKVPFGVAQVGKAFRNEITPGNFIFRTREFEQMEIEYFCEPENIAPGKHLELHAEWKNECKRFLVEVIGIKEESLRLRDHEKEELSHYSAATTDIEFKFPFGWGELWGIADRTDFDLKAHMNESKQDLSYFDPYTNTKYIPYVIEPSVGLTRLFLATLANAYEEITNEEGTRIVMRLVPAVAPIKVAVYPLVKKFADQANALYDILSEHFVCEYDEAGTIGKRYQRSEEMGIPYAIAVEPENYDEGQVTVRDRDSGTQEIVKIENLVTWLKNKGC